MSFHSLQESLYSSIRYLDQAGIQNPAMDARLLVQWVTGTSLIDTIMHPGRLLSLEEQKNLTCALQRRRNREPVHRILGERAFYGVDFILSPHTFEPRPDTETLVDLVLPFLKEHACSKEFVNCLDLGTGCGAIAIALLVNVLSLHTIGIDISEDALLTAHLNAMRVGVEDRLFLFKSDWLRSVSGIFDLIVSNPPYIPSGDIVTLDLSVRNFDPLLALNGGKDGLDFYRLLATHARRYLHPFTGKIAVEIGIQQKESVLRIFSQCGYHLESMKTDLSGTERALMFGQ
ncbi:MAG: release factor glutamine methyltransferase [Candidatus Tokpelaia sp. JSC161]|jgi:release factor glutamine methyltransferase|nr:MAG: release factor glutamine methyltransferase [Candidatus Tokpelaia sp. JSC161]